jgi:hypothetical protein
LDCLVVDEYLRPELLGAEQLLIAAGRDDGPRADHARELKGEDRHAACALKQYRVARRELPLGDERIPRGQRRARQCGGLLVTQVFRNGDNALGRQGDVLGEHAVEVAAEGGPGLDGVQHSLKPTLHEDPRYPVARLHVSDAQADAHHLPRPVGARDARQFHARVVRPFHDEQVAVVERHRPHANEHLTGAGGRFGPLDRL